MMAEQPLNRVDFEHENWRFSVQKGPIASRQIVDEWQTECGFPMPTMLFDRTELSLEFAPLRLNFNALDALRCVSTKQPDFNVRGSEEWVEARQEHADILERTVSPFDWTFSSHYASTLTLNGDSLQWQPLDEQDTERTVDYERLKQQEPILYFQEIILFEDELADNGLTRFSIKLRVMPSCFFLLARCWVRVEGILFRVLDTRLYHAFGSTHLCCEKRVQEEEFDAVCARLPADKLFDMDFVASQLPRPRLLQNYYVPLSP